jgi:hypothetical protein
MKSGIYTALSTLTFLIIWLVMRKVCKKEVSIVEKKFAAQKMFKFLDGDSIVIILLHEQYRKDASFRLTPLTPSSDSAETISRST